MDKGLEPEKDGVQLMKPMPELDSMCDVAVSKGVFGTKMRSVINFANKEGIKAIVEEQFRIGKQIMAKGLIPILEPEGKKYLSGMCIEYQYWCSSFFLTNNESCFSQYQVSRKSRGRDSAPCRIDGESKDATR